ncbi:MAG: hypothetical protein JWS10_451 [Cypionkella sp.]|nr:hypothetical protein [Cypionkella sp.]
MAAPIDLTNMPSARGYPAHPALVVVGNDAVRVLAESGFRVTSHVAFTEALAFRLKIDLSATLTVMRNLPLWVDGPQHAELRRKVATFLAEDRLVKLARAKARIRAAIAKALGSGGPARVDLLALVREVVDVFMEEITGIPRPDGDLSSLPSIFSSNLGVAARRRLEASLKRQFEMAQNLFPAEPPERHALRVGQWTMGRDPLIGSLGLSLHDHITSLDGASLCERRLPSVPTQTGVPAIGRIANFAQTVAGCPVAEGALIECRLDSLTGRPAAERQHFFGAGPHLCLGRPFTLAFWDCVADALADQDISLTVCDFALAQNDVFDIPSVFTARTTSLSQLGSEAL